MALSPTSSRASTFDGGTITQPLVIAPTSAAVVPLKISLPVGASTAGQIAIQVARETSGSALIVDAYGDVIASADTVDPTNGGGNFAANNHLGVQKFQALADDGAGGNTLGVYGHAGAAQPAAIPNAAGGAIIDAEARTALNAALAALRSNGLLAT